MSAELSVISGGQMATLALAHLFDILIEDGKPLITKEVLGFVRSRLDNAQASVARSDVQHGWSETHQGDPKNDYPGDILAKRADNMIFLYGRELPGKATDFIRDQLSPSITPGVRAQIDGTTSATQLAAIVADALYAAAEAMVAHALDSAAAAAGQAGSNLAPKLGLAPA